MLPQGAANKEWDENLSTVYIYCRILKLILVG